MPARRTSRITAPKVITFAVRSPAAIVTSSTSVPSDSVPNRVDVMRVLPDDIGAAARRCRSFCGWFGGANAAFLSNGLVVGADRRVLAHDRVHDLEHLAHARLRHRAFDHDDQLRLVRRG